MHAPFTLYNNVTGFMEARNKDGSWAGDTRGWTEGKPFNSSVLGSIFLNHTSFQATSGLTPSMLFMPSLS